ncbi:MAG: Stp1/IreP family PP2C-type Ser/Thr phosphatase [Tissierellales bacterium]|jgi:protein phosphatase|nr:Stp1/IreP family PP2C-type Ser/Thr phosphatase [Tissierellales bacterium]
MKIGFSTDVGLKREINQDALYVSKQQKFPIIAVADGMGGHNAGEIASAIFVEVLEEYEKILLETEDPIIPRILNEVFEKANNEIFKRSEIDESCEGMGTTATVAIIDWPTMYIGHVGDSRLYLYAGEGLKQLTKDHSIVGEMLRNGEISDEEANNHPQKNIITKAVGTHESVIADFSEVELDDGFMALVCSDGLTNMLNSDEIEEIISRHHEDLHFASEELVKKANASGGLDNITVILIKFD